MHANWRLSQWISMDDYHLAAVHPRSLHVAGKYLRRDALNYQRFGPHSAYFTGPQSFTLGDWTARLRDGQPDGPGYRILHLFPNAGITLLPTVPFLGLRLPLRYIVVQRHVAVEPGRTRLEVRIIPVPPAGHGLRAHLLATWQRLVAPLIRRGTLRVLREDQAVCENLQSIARQITPDALYGSAEERVAWFNAAYAAAMAVPMDERD